MGVIGKGRGVAGEESGRGLKTGRRGDGVDGVDGREVLHSGWRDGNRDGDGVHSWCCRRSCHSCLLACLLVCGVGCGVGIADTLTWFLFIFAQGLFLSGRGGIGAGSGWVGMEGRVVAGGCWFLITDTLYKYLFFFC